MAPSTVSSAAVARTGKMFAWSQVATAAAADGPGATGEAKRLPGALRDEVGREQRRAQRAAAIEARGDRGRVVDAHRDPHEPAVERRRAHPRAARDGVERERDRDAVLRDQRVERPWPELDPPLGALVALAAGLEERDAAADRGVGRGRLEHELHPRVVVRVPAPAA